MTYLYISNSEKKIPKFEKKIIFLPVRLYSLSVLKYENDNKKMTCHIFIHKYLEGKQMIRRSRKKKSFITLMNFH